MLVVLLVWGEAGVVSELCSSQLCCCRLASVLYSLTKVLTPEKTSTQDLCVDIYILFISLLAKLRK